MADTEPETAAEAESPVEAEATVEAEAPEDELKRKFREALDRKRRTQAEANAGGQGKGSAKIHGAQGAAGGRRSFRRKSGG
ncbi:DUF5302 domain-containing protein [Planotetraspora sp. GP83]|uniref:DUF5302 domain-containing protein n=1 Tax=Planotetraspora sp. GP83 TaxID=3156264 RepID=UPI0035133E4F